jgi:hypothetical protein
MRSQQENLTRANTKLSTVENYDLHPHLKAANLNLTGKHIYTAEHLKKYDLEFAKKSNSALLMACAVLYNKCI